MQSKRTPAANMALGGILAALAVVIMSLGSLIPGATYVCPMACILMVKAVRRTCGVCIAWAWYAAVAILGLLLAADKEAAAVFAFLGYYPIIRPKLQRLKASWLWKLLLFNGSMTVMYRLLTWVLGVEMFVAASETAEAVMLVIFLILGNVAFFLLDRLLGLRLIRKH